MSFAKTSGSMFDLLTPLLVNIFHSQYVNLGYWDKTTKTIAAAQEKLVDVFGRFSKLKKGLEVIDVGCGTGEQDLYFLDHFQCKQIVGINISEIQVQMALDKIKNKKLSSSKIKFEIDDALNLKKRNAESCDRVLALECSQYFAKKKFAQGAFHVLRSGGYLCLAEVAYDFPFQMDEKKFPNLLNRIKNEEIKKKYGTQLEERFHFLLQTTAQPLENHLKEIHISSEEHIKILKKKGFEIEGVEEITEKVNRFYPTVEKEVLKILEKDQLNHYQMDLCFTFLALSYISYCALSNRLGKFCFIRARKP